MACYEKFRPHQCGRLRYRYPALSESAQAVGVPRQTGHCSREGTIGARAGLTQSNMALLSPSHLEFQEAGDGSVPPTRR